MCRAVGPVMDQEAERDVQPVRLADAASRPPGGADHRQHHGPAGEDHDQQSGEQTGEGAGAVLRINAVLSRRRDRINAVLE